MKNLNILNEYEKQIENIIDFYEHFHQDNSDILPLLLLHGPNGSGKTRCVELLSQKLALNLSKVNCVNLAGESASAVEKRIDIFLQHCLTKSPCLILFKSFHFLFKLKDINEFNKRIVNSFFHLIQRLKQQHQQQEKQQQKQEEKSLNCLNECHETNKQQMKFFIICTTDSKQSINSDLISNFNYEIELKSLNDQQRRIFFESKLENIIEIEDKNTSNYLDDLVKRTNGLFYGEMETLCDLIIQNINFNFDKQDDESKDDESKDDENKDDKDDKDDDEDKMILNIETIENVFKKFISNRKFQQENKLNIDLVKWSDVGGLNDIKEIITDTILLPLKYPKLFKSSANQIGMTRSGILLYGPPGTGKTLLAKAISNECGLNFLSVKGPELLDMYVGQTEKNVRNLFEKARLNSPCILFFDELDSLAPVRGRAGDSAGVMDRVVSQLLTEIDGLDKYNSSSSSNDTNESNQSNGQIFIIGATNRPDLIDQSLLRPGRFDKLVYVPIAKDLAERIKIFQALIRKLPIDASFNIEEFVQKCPLNLSGADFYSITNKARQNAIKRLINSIENNEVELKNENLDEVVNENDFNQALIGFRANLTESELIDYEKYFNKFSNKN